MSNLRLAYRVGSKILEWRGPLILIVFFIWMLITFWRIRFRKCLQFVKTILPFTFGSFGGCCQKQKLNIHERRFGPFQSCCNGDQVTWREIKINWHLRTQLLLGGFNPVSLRQFFYIILNFLKYPKFTVLGNNVALWSIIVAN